MKNKYLWEDRLEEIKQFFVNNLPNADNREKTAFFLRETTKKLVELLQEHVSKDFSVNKVPEIMEFLKKSVVYINGLLPLTESLRLGVKIPMDDPRIEFRLIDYIYTKHGHLPYIDDCCPSHLAGECVAVVFLNPHKNEKPLN